MGTGEGGGQKPQSIVSSEGNLRGLESAQNFDSGERAKPCGI